MSACMRSLYSSDQCAPGLRLVVFCGRGMGAVFRSLGDLHASTFSLSMTRVDLALQGEFELFMQLWAPIAGCYVAHVGFEQNHGRDIRHRL
jgi:hypothetical protein